MPDTTDAEMQDQGGRTSLRFERILAHPPDRVWRALTELGELESWHPTPFELEPRVGGLIRFLPAHGAPPMAEGTVTACEPPSLLAHTWGEDSLRWEISPHPRGSTLTLTHTFDDRLKAARDAAGWHLRLQELSDTLDEAMRPAQIDADGLPSGWRQLNRPTSSASGSRRSRRRRRRVADPRPRVPGVVPRPVSRLTPRRQPR